MSDPVSGTTIAAGGLMGASMFGLATGIDYGVVFGAFAGAVFLRGHSSEYFTRKAGGLLHDVIHCWCSRRRTGGLKAIKLDRLQRSPA